MLIFRVLFFLFWVETLFYSIEICTIRVSSIDPIRNVGVAKKKQKFTLTIPLKMTVFLPQVIKEIKRLLRRWNQEKRSQLKKKVAVFWWICQAIIWPAWLVMMRRVKIGPFGSVSSPSAVLCSTQMILRKFLSDAECYISFSYSKRAHAAIHHMVTE